MREVVGRYGTSGRDWVHHWGIWNEPGGNSFAGTVEDYLELLNAAYEVVHAEDAYAEVWAPDTTGCDLFRESCLGDGSASFGREVIKASNFDRFSLHVYGSLQNNYQRVAESREYLDSQGRQETPLMITETNLPGPWAGGTCVYSCTPDTAESCVNEQGQAEELINRYVCLANAGAETVFWFKSADNAVDRCADGVNRNGVLDRNLEPKPAYYALKMLGEHLEASAPGSGVSSLLDLFTRRAAWVRGDETQALLGHLKILRAISWVG